MEEAEYLKFIQMKRQASTPFMPLINAAQLWMDADNHLQGRLHKQGDPGLDVEYKLMDFLYATFFGACETVTCAAEVNLTAGAYNQLYCLVDQDVTFNISGGHEGQFLCFVLKQDETGDWVVTFNTGFQVSGTKTAGAGEYSAVLFQFDDVNDLWHELIGGAAPAGGGGGIPKGEAFPWVFKMVDETDVWTPETGKTPAVVISKDHAAFAGLTGSPAVSEIGSGWYGVTVPAADMDADAIVLLATAAGCAQADQAIYPVEVT